ncbi:Lrp/AsnC family transcriptional regulator [Curvibacter sp. APW13]|uniref:Lrp/AsnC family transcriptional regulator n=1 Tax=Curvibacter sp. APW13 TaxID=3077236 RepID=UPI0028DF7EB9|nr:Lrp/AsnC family transcriptional regulator [Curvibacter sp. APW13]MDT8990376.1 Lrp/AsnC family transcriptional regulator [Curvibacter sp. APW13]
MALDSIDHKILALLQEDGRISNQALADQVALSPSACLRRVRQLEEAGVIARYRAELDPRALGLDVDAFVQVTMRQEVEGWHESFLAAVQRWPQVVGAWIVTGECNYILRIRAKSLKEYSQFAIEHLHKERGVKEIRSNIVMQGIKSGETVVPSALLPR